MVVSRVGKRRNTSEGEDGSASADSGAKVRSVAIDDLAM